MRVWGAGVRLSRGVDGSGDLGLGVSLALALMTLRLSFSDSWAVGDVGVGIMVIGPLDGMDGCF